MSEPIELRCPRCGAVPGSRCRAASGRVTDYHTARSNCLGFTGRDDQGRQFCLTCQQWKFPAIHSCPGVPQFSKR
jgi:hypothetical protein